MYTPQQIRHLTPKTTQPARRKYGGQLTLTRVFTRQLSTRVGWHGSYRPSTLGTWGDQHITNPPVKVSHRKSSKMPGKYHQNACFFPASYVSLESGGHVTSVQLVNNTFMKTCARGDGVFWRQPKTNGIRTVRRFPAAEKASKRKMRESFRRKLQVGKML